MCAGFKLKVTCNSIEQVRNYRFSKTVTNLDDNKSIYTFSIEHKIYVDVKILLESALKYPITYYLYYKENYFCKEIFN